jgi:hypothetical protein
MRDLRLEHRIKRRVCAVCGVSFQSVRRDALYCSLSCGQRAHRAGKTHLFPKAAQVGERGAVQSAIATQAPLAPSIEVQAHPVAEPERLGKIDSPIENAAKRGAPSTIGGQHKARQVLAGERQREASTVATLEVERASLIAKRRQIEDDEAAPLWHEPIGADADSGWAIRWLLALMVLCCDPPAKASTTAESARN